MGSIAPSRDDIPALRAPAGDESGSSLLEGVDVPDQRPAIVVGQVLPRGHGPAPGGDLPEELPVRLVLDRLRGPVGRLRSERRRRRAIALALGAVAGNAVDLGHLRPLLEDLL